jgi:hypothetical protein
MSETKNVTSSEPGVEKVIDQVRGVGNRVLASGGELYGSYLDSVDSAVANYASFERKLSEQGVYRGLSPMLTAHADMTERVVTHITGRVRGFVNTTS